MPRFPRRRSHPRVRARLWVVPLLALVCAGCGASTQLGAPGRQALLADISAAQAGLSRHDATAVRGAVRRFQGEVSHLRAAGELTAARSAELTRQAQAILTEAGSLNGGVLSATTRRLTTSTATETNATTATAEPVSTASPAPATPAPPAGPGHGHGPGGAGPPGQHKHKQKGGPGGPPGPNQGPGNDNQGPGDQNQGSDN